MSVEKGKAARRTPLTSALLEDAAQTEFGLAGQQVPGLGCTLCFREEEWSAPLTHVLWWLSVVCPLLQKSALHTGRGSEEALTADSSRKRRESSS